MIPNKDPKTGRFLKGSTYKQSEEHKKKIGDALRGRTRVMSPETREKMRIAHLGKPHPNKGHWVKGMKAPWATGANHYNWKGGITTEHEKIRKSAEYKDWRQAVFKRDNYTCQLCFKKGGNINADHIKSFYKHKESRLDIDNGRTLCVPCHKTTPNWGKKAYLV